MTTFRRSNDYALIREILTDPRCLRRMSPGFAGSLAIEFSPRIEYILADQGGAIAAVFLIVDGFEIHFCFRPRMRGKTEPVARAFLAWVWASTPATRLVGLVPKHNRLALRLARAVGFTEFAAGSNAEHVQLEIRKPCSSD